MEPPLVPSVAAPSPAPAGCLSLINRAGRLASIDGNGVVREFEDAAAIAAAIAAEPTFDGEPVNYVAEVPATAMSETYTVDSDKTVTLTAKTPGVLDPAPKLVVTAPDALPAGSRASLAIVSQSAGVVTVRPQTGHGDKATLTIPMSGNDSVFEMDLNGPDGIDGNAYYLEAKLEGNGHDPFGASILKPSNSLSFLLETQSLSLTLATGTGTPGVLVLEESSTDETTGLGSLTITQKDAFAGAWGNGHVTAEVVFSGVSSPFSVDVELGATDLAIIINLATTAEGLPIAKADTEIATAINAKLATITGPGGDLDDVLLAESEGTGKFSTLQVAVSMGVAGGGADGVDPVADNLANTTALIEKAIDTGGDGVFSLKTAGTAGGYYAASDLTSANRFHAPIYFSGGGANSAITTTLAELTTMLHAAPSTIIDCTAGAGAQTTPIEPTAGVTLTGGSNVVPAVPGTPGKRGRTATDGTDVWTALKEDPTTTQDGWVKTYSAGA